MSLDEDGNFCPKGFVTRADFATIAAYIKLGKTTGDFLTVENAPFKDVPADHPASGKIAYCVQSGTMSGYADGSFQPDNPITLAAFMRVMLTCLNFNAKAEGYLDADWLNRVEERAQELGLLNNVVSYNGTSGLTREVAAQIVYNTVDFRETHKIWLLKFVYNNDATETSAGTETAACSHCGMVLTRNVTASETEGNTGTISSATIKHPSCRLYFTP